MYTKFYLKIKMIINKEVFNLIIVGTGSYVCGRGANEYGTILPAILTYSKRFSEKINIIFACTSENGRKNVERKVGNLTNLIQTGDLTTFEFCLFGNSPENFCKKFNNHNGNTASIISIPDNFHYQWIKEMLKQKIQTLTVKPLTLKLSEAEELYTLSKSEKTSLFVEFHKRYDRQLKYAKNLFEKNIIGTPLYSFTEYTQRKTIPLNSFRNWCEDTNIFSYLGVHYVDALHYVTNATPLKVSATGQKNFLRKEGIDAFDSIQATIIWQDDNNNLFNQTILCSWVESNLSSAMSKQNFNLIGTNGRIECEQKERGLRVLTDLSNTEEVNPDFTKMYQKENYYEFEGYGIDSIINFIHYARKSNFCINDRKLCSVKEALISTSVIEAVSESLEQTSSWQFIKKSKN